MYTKQLCEFMNVLKTEMVTKQVKTQNPKASSALRTKLHGNLCNCGKSLQTVMTLIKKKHLLFCAIIWRNSLPLQLIKCLSLHFLHSFDKLFIHTHHCPLFCWYKSLTIKIGTKCCQKYSVIPMPLIAFWFQFLKSLPITNHIFDWLLHYCISTNYNHCCHCICFWSIQNYFWIDYM